MNIVGYIRLSRDEDNENYSSIEGQKQIINDYAKSRNWMVSKFYIDDNISGYTLNRPALQEMLSELNNIDVMIAKDLSRIGRRNGKVGNLIEDFQDNKNRLILVNEGNDGFDILDDNDDILGIKTWYNEMYVKDISKKIRTSMNAKQKSGELIMGNYYGYKKVRIENKNHLLIDENIKPIIELIFKLYIDQLGYKKICDVLDEKGYPTPSQYIKQRHEDNGRIFKNPVSEKWQTHMIYRIIKDDVYVGNLRTKKRQSKSIKGKQEKVHREDQYVFKNHHEAMISNEIYELAKQINDRKRESNFRNNAKYNYIFTGFMQCSDCGFMAIGLNLGKKPKEKRGYNCTTYQKYGKTRCTNHSVSEAEVLFFLKEFLKDVRNEYQEYIDSVDLKQKKSNVEKILNEAQKDLEITKKELKLLITQKLKELMKEENIDYKQIVENSYNELEIEKKKKINELTQKVTELRTLNNNDIEKIIKSTIEVFDTLINTDIPEKSQLEIIIDRIYINKDKTLDFKLKVNIDKLS